MTERVPDSAWDPGLQPERTSLAWQRTWLALLSGGLIVARLVAQYSAFAGIAVAAGSVLLAATLGRLGSRRYAELQHQLHADIPQSRGGFNALLLASFLLVGISGLAYALLVTG